MPNAVTHIHIDRSRKMLKIVTSINGKEVHHVAFDAIGAADIARKLNGACREIGVTPSLLILPGDLRWAREGLNDKT